MSPGTRTNRLRKTERLRRGTESGTKEFGPFGRHTLTVPLRCCLQSSPNRPAIQAQPKALPLAPTIHLPRDRGQFVVLHFGDDFGGNGLAGSLTPWKFHLGPIWLQPPLPICMSRTVSMRVKSTYRNVIFDNCTYVNSTRASFRQPAGMRCHLTTSHSLLAATAKNGQLRRFLTCLTGCDCWSGATFQMLQNFEGWSRGRPFLRWFPCF